MESLYTKYRPQTFEQVVGQGHVVETLKRAVLENRVSHAYLFCGPRGTGKTTMARILAKALMCEGGPAALPDGTCEQCRLIAAGEHPDVIELDAASRTGVDSVREEIIGRVSYAPAMGRAKVYIIDEVHMLTVAAFNALLKTLEEPPEHVVFVMCTTDPQKIPATILSRVQRFDFRSIGADEMQAHLAYVCGQEGFSYDPAALELVVRHARGGMRDALTSLEQLSVFGDGRIGLDEARDLLGEVSGSVLADLTRAMAHRDVPALFSEVARLADAGRDPLQLTRELAAHLRDVYVVAVAPSADDVVAARGSELEALRAEAAAFGSADRVARVLTILGDASSEMRTATNQRLVLEIALTRVARPESDLTLESLAERVADLERQVALLARPGAVTAATVTAEKPVEAAPAPQPQSPQPSAHSEGQNRSDAREQPRSSLQNERLGTQNRSDMKELGEKDVAPAAPEQVPAPAPTAPEPAAPATAPQTPAASGGLSDSDLQRAWKRVVEELVASIPAKGSLLLSSTPVSDDGEKVTVSLPKGSHFAARMLERSDVRQSVDATVASVMGPRQVIYVESSLASQAISQAGRAPAPQSAPAPAAPALAPQPQTAPQSAAPAYPMPWDEPAAPQPPADDVVPYDDADAAPYEEDAQPPAPTAQPAAAPAPSPAPFSAPAPKPEPAPAPQPKPAPAEPEPAPAPQPAASPADFGSEFAGIVSMLSETFGQPIPAHFEPAGETSDEEAAAELSEDAGQTGGYAPEDGGFVDEPVEDGDEDDE